MNSKWATLKCLLGLHDWCFWHAMLPKDGTPRLQRRHCWRCPAQQVRPWKPSRKREPVARPGG